MAGEKRARLHIHPPPFLVDALNFTAGLISSNSKADNPNTIIPQSDGEAIPLEALLPASYRKGHLELEVSSLSLEYLSQELGLQRLEGFNQWFWLLSSPCLPRPLHDCAFLRREICITESMDRHLGLGRTNKLYLKPVPRILLDPRFWTDFLPCDDGCHATPELEAMSGPKAKKCAKRQIFECALGFLFSYAALVSHESDFRLAKARNLLPPEIPWSAWRMLTQQVINYPDLHEVIHKRFLYGELRLHRLKEMAQLRRGGLVQVLVGRLDLFARFFQTNAPWLASFVAWIVVVLTALQVGLETNTLEANDAFQSFSHGFTVFSLIAPVVVIVGFGIYFGMDLTYYLMWNMLDAKHGDRMRRMRMAKTKNKLSNGSITSAPSAPSSSASAAPSPPESQF